MIPTCQGTFYYRGGAVTDDLIKLAEEKLYENPVFLEPFSEACENEYLDIYELTILYTASHKSSKWGDCRLLPTYVGICIMLMIDDSQLNYKPSIVPYERLVRKVIHNVWSVLISNWHNLHDVFDIPKVYRHDTLVYYPHIHIKWRTKWTE